jgi:hypothetical protein
VGDREEKGVSYGLRLRWTAVPEHGRCYVCQIRRGGPSQRKTAQCLELHAQVKGAEGEHALAAEHLQRALDLWPATIDPKGTDSLQVSLLSDPRAPHIMHACVCACHPPFSYHR